MELTNGRRRAVVTERAGKWKVEYVLDDEVEPLSVGGAFCTSERQALERARYWTERGKTS